MEVVISSSGLSVWLLLLATFDSTESQVDSLLCTEFCLMGLTTCTCTVTGDSLEWEVTGIGNGGLIVLENEHLNTSQPLIGLPAFGAVLLDNSSGTLTALLNFTTLAMYEEGTIICDQLGSTSSSVPINISAEPSQPENLIAITDTSTGSVLLSWAPPTTNSECVVSYILISSLSNLTISIPNTLNYTIFATGEMVSCCTCTARVAAKDTGGRIGVWSQEVEFVLAGSPSQPMNITFSAFVMNASLKLNWDAPNDTFDCVSYYLINTTTNEMLLITNDTSVLITRPAEDPTSSTYTVSVAAVDIFNRTGQWSDPLCYLFQVPSGVISHSSYHDCNTSSFYVEWYVTRSVCQPVISLSSACYPLSNDGFIAFDNTHEKVASGCVYTQSGVDLGEVYVIEIVPSNALGNGSSTILTINISDACPMASNPFLSSTTVFKSTFVSSGSCASCVVIGVTMAIALIAVLIMIVVSILMAYLIWCKKKGSHPATDSKSEMPMKSEYTSPQISQQTTSTQLHVQENIQFPMSQKYDHFNIQEHHPQANEGHSAQEQKKTIKLNRGEITDTEGYSELPAIRRKSSASKRSLSKEHYADLEVLTTGMAPLPSQDTVKYISLQPILEYAGAEKNEGEH